VVVLARILPTALELKSGREYQRVVTEREQAQASLEHERFLLRTLLEFLPDDRAIFFKATEGRFTQVSKSLATRFGCQSPDEVIGKSDADFYPPEFAAKTRADEAEVMRTGKTLVGEPERIHWPANGLAWVATTKVLLRDESGQIAGTFGISHDVTEMKSNEEALRLSEERFELAVRGSTDGLWDWNVATSEVYF